MKPVVPTPLPQPARTPSPAAGLWPRRLPPGVAARWKDRYRVALPAV